MRTRHTPAPGGPDELAERLGRIDIYLLDQVLRGRIPPRHRILDAGCGNGRNVVYFLREGYEVAAADAHHEAVAAVRRLASELAPTLPASSFRHEPVESLSFPDHWADVVVSSAVLHFAGSHEHFRAMLEGCWRVLRPGGLFFCRLASTIGMSRDRFEPLAEGRFTLPDGSERYLVDEERLLALTNELGGGLLDPLKTTVVQDRRCMTTWVIRKSA